VTGKVGEITSLPLGFFVRTLYLPQDSDCRFFFSSPSSTSRVVRMSLKESVSVLLKSMSRAMEMVEMLSSWVFFPNRARTSAFPCEIRKVVGLNQQKKKKKERKKRLLPC